MSAALHLAKAEHLEQVLALVSAFHEEQGITQTEATRRTAVGALLNGSPYGAVYIIGPTRAPIGYVIVSFGWSVEFGGMDGVVDELYIRPRVRGRGIATEVLLELPKALAGAGLTALHLEVDRDNETARRLYARTGFESRERFMLMSKRL